MNIEENLKLKRKILNEIEIQKQLISRLFESAKPVAPNNARGRLTRMESNKRSKRQWGLIELCKVKLVKIRACFG